MEKLTFVIDTWRQNWLRKLLKEQNKNNHPIGLYADSSDLDFYQEQAK